ncbi:hypothetical protein [Anabaena azotica]|uniref:Uncharacterized protein n=1 Tax=Anabaena azotica FACHB-119 TaxID=947527 RepID=A0ABR8CXK2_9NOST|nr:hypothetical protein [Anabaena azotica]MBD2499437.1 hypothetical protein [Anabaena azotica FACHB-119]
MANTDVEELVNKNSIVKSEKDDFQTIVTHLDSNNLDANRIIDAIKSAIVEVVELEITTWVEEPSTSGEEAVNITKVAKPGNRIYTKINLISGDIENEVGSQFLASGPYAELLNFHLVQVKDSREIMQKNIESVQKIYKILMEMYNSRKTVQI